MNLLNQLKYKFKTGNISIKLIYINVFAFFSILVINYILSRGLFQFIPIDNIDRFLSLPSDFREFYTKPWSILTYAFSHANLWHLVFNMVFLYFVSSLFLRYFRGYNLLTFYIFGAISGGTLFLLLPDVFNYSSALVGASAAVYAIFFALISYMPKMPVRFFFINNSFPLVYLGYGLLAYDTYMILVDNNTGGHISHLGGALFGYLYMKQFEKGNDVLGKFIFSITNWNENRKLKKKSNSLRAKTDYEFSSNKVERQKRIDAILDKISRSGYDSLSKEEKDFLFKEGR